MNKVIVNSTDRKSDIFKVGDLILIQACTGGYSAMITQVDSGMVAVISLSEGNRWTSPIEIHDVGNISFDAVLLMTNGKEFERINSVTITGGDS